MSAPATVGLLGGFGTGKSSIGNLLAKHLQGHKDFEVVSLSAEKHSGTARQRALVYSFAEALEEDAGVDPKATSKALRRVESTEDTEEPQLKTLPLANFARDNKRFLGAALAMALALAAGVWLVGVVVALVIRAVSDSDPNPLTWPLSSNFNYATLWTFTFALLVVVFGGWMTAALTPRSQRRSVPRAEAADELERVFSDLAGLVDKRLIIVVDDIDRLSPGEVLEALATIKTLQAVPKKKPPVFVITCDDGIVRQALAEVDPGLSKVEGKRQTAAEEYLNKLFVVRQPLPPHLREDMRGHAERLLRTSKHTGVDALGDQRLRDTLDILIHPNVDNPRHVVRLLNAFFADYRLARVRQGSNGRLGPGEVTDHPELLARLTVLRVDFLVWYERIRHDFGLLEALDADVTGAPVDGVQQQLLTENKWIKDSAQNAPLADFLRRTVRYVEQGLPLEPFFYMGQTSAGRTLGSRKSNEIRNSLVNNNSEAITGQLQTADSAVAAAVVDHVVQLLPRQREGIDLANAVSTAAAVLQDVPDGDRSRLADEIATILERYPSAVPPAEGLAATLKYADPVHTDALISFLINFDGEEAEDAEHRAVVLLDVAEVRPTDARLSSSLRNYFASLPTTAGWADAARWLPRVKTLAPERRNLIIDDTFYHSLTKVAVGATEGQITPTELADLETLVDEAGALFDPEGKVRAGLHECVSAESTAPRWFAVRLLQHISVPDDELATWLELLVDVALDEDFPPQDETLLCVLQLVDVWTGAHSLAVSSVEGATVESLVQMLATAAGHLSSDVVQAAAAATTAFGRVHPNAVTPALTALLAVVDQHAETNNDTAKMLRRHLLELLPTLPAELSSLVASGLTTKGLGESAPAEARQFAVESIPLIARTTGGVALVERLTVPWVSVVKQGATSTKAVTRALSALRQAAFRGALPDEQEGELLSRASELLAQGPPATELAGAVLSLIPWRPQHRSNATKMLVQCWTEVGTPERNNFVKRVSEWNPGAGDLSQEFSERIVDLYLDREANAPLDAVEKLSPALDPASRARLFGGLAVEQSAVAVLAPLLTTGELTDALVFASNAGAVPALVAVAVECEAETRRGAAVQFIVRSLDDAGIGWDSGAIEAVVARLLDSADVPLMADTAVKQLGDGAAAAMRGATLLGALRQKNAAGVVAHHTEIEEAVRVLLPESAPELAYALGRAAAHSSKTAFREELKALRGEALSVRLT